MKFRKRDGDLKKGLPNGIKIGEFLKVLTTHDHVKYVSEAEIAGALD